MSALLEIEQLEVSFGGRTAAVTSAPVRSDAVPSDAAPAGLSGSGADSGASPNEFSW